MFHESHSRSNSAMNQAFVVFANEIYMTSQTSTERVSVGDEIIKEDIIQSEIEESGNSLEQVIPKPESIPRHVPGGVAETRNPDSGQSRYGHNANIGACYSGSTTSIDLPFHRPRSMVS